MEKKDLGKTSTGIKPNAAGLLCYLLGFITGIIFYLIEKDNKFVRFHAMQSIVVFGSLFVLGMVLSFMFFVRVYLLPFLWLVELVLWIVLMIKAYQGEYFKLPIAGDIAEKNS
jgi:uncharacterized membrane protein